MKQGTGNKTYAPKGKMTTKEANLSAVSRYGAHDNVQKKGAEFKTIGVSAPKAIRTKHPTGTQGKHK